MPHVPLFTSEDYEGVSEQGKYGDVIMEVDWSVGQIMGALAEHGIDRNTLMIFTSDNGPWLSYGNHAGSAGPLREGKGTTWEGGVREPCIMRWPGRIPAGTECNELAATIDMVPTVAEITGTELPDHPIDGLSILGLMTSETPVETPHDVYYYYWGNHLQAIRSGDWKLHFPHNYRSLTGEPGRDGRPGGYTQQHTDLALFNLADDIGETTDIKDTHPDVVQRMQRLADAAREELGDQGRRGSGYRAPAQIE
jgi:arylsulfatase A-like enzyme